jgi:hypothetical protein
MICVTACPPSQAAATPTHRKRAGKSITVTRASARSPCVRAIRPTPTRGAGAAASIRGSHPRECTSGTAASFDQARRDFEEAWRVFLANRTEADFDEYRKHRAWTAWKYAMWDSGCKLPTQ